tara:strand:- start:16608 stop:17792 length:1185 start_codon:yes stop_codon:yes gene_type:complete
MSGFPKRAEAAVQAGPVIEAGPVIRAATIDDLDALCRIEAECFETDLISRRSFRQFLKSDSDDLLVIDHAGALAGYALILYRRGTSVARLYSLAVTAAVRGMGLGAGLMAAAEDAAYERAASVLRLEVREDNPKAQDFYRRLEYREFGRIKDYYEDGATAFRFQKWLSGEPPADLRRLTYYAQTTDFTCGPAAVMMAMNGLDQTVSLDRTSELALWREATTIYMLRGLGGCEPLGLANVMARRGFRVAVHRSEPGPHFLDSVRSDAKRAVMMLVQADYARAAEELGVAVSDTALGRQELIEALDRGAVAVVLLSHYRLTGTAVPHWVTVYGHDDDRFYIHDPWIELKELPEDIFHGAALPIPFDEYDRLTRYGRNNFRAALIVEAAGSEHQKKA